jgi:hypothetical protein
MDFSADVDVVDSGRHYHRGVAAVMAAEVGSPTMSMVMAGSWTATDNKRTSARK